MANSKEQGSRLDNLRKILGFSQIAFSKRLGLSQGYLNQVINGNRNISYKILNAISGQFPQVNAQWLLTGVGEMFLPDEIPRMLAEPAANFGSYKKVTVEGLADIIFSMQMQIHELQRRVDELSQKHYSAPANGSD